jgi:CheY-like chemotaxis protein
MSDKAHLKDPEHAQGINSSPFSIQYDDELLRARVLSALVVDDEAAARESLRKTLVEIGYSTTAVSSLEQAREALRDSSFSLVLCDNIFGDPSKPRGSVFILNERPLFRSAAVVLITGFAAAQIVDMEVLEKSGVKIAVKKVGYLEKIHSFAQATADRTIASVKLNLEKFINDIVGHSPTPLSRLRMGYLLAKGGADLLARYLNNFPDQDEEQFCIGGHFFSPRALIAEIESGTDIGAHTVKMFLEDFVEDDDGAS